VGTLLLPLLTCFGHRSFTIAQSAVWTAETLLRGPVVLLFRLVCWLRAWQRASPRLARTLCLSRQELILIDILATVGTARCAAPGGVGLGFAAEASRDRREGRASKPTICREVGPSTRRSQCATVTPGRTA
jgi:hypothetical protein